MIGYNPQQPGRPSHVYHSHFVANLRISLGVEVRPGNEHAAAKGLPGLWQTLDKLPRHRGPTFSRGDSGFGSEGVMLEHEERGLPYLFKLRHTPKVKEHGRPHDASRCPLARLWRRLAGVRKVRPLPESASSVVAKIAKNFCPKPEARVGTPTPLPGAGKSPCSSPR